MTHRFEYQCLPMSLTPLSGATTWRTMASRESCDVISSFPFVVGLHFLDVPDVLPIPGAQKRGGSLLHVKDSATSWHIRLWLSKLVLTTLPQPFGRPPTPSRLPNLTLLCFSSRTLTPVDFPPGSRVVLFFHASRTKSKTFHSRTVTAPSADNKSQTHFGIAPSHPELDFKL